MMNMMSNKKMMSKEEYYALMKGQGLTNEYVIEPLWNKYKASFSKSLVSSQQDMLMKQNQNRPPVQVKPNKPLPVQDTKTTPPAHRVHLPNPQAPKSVVPHKHTGAPSISQSGAVKPAPPKPDVEKSAAVHTNPPVSNYTPSKTLPAAPVRKSIPGFTPISEKLFKGQQRTQGRMATHANYLQYLKNHGQQLANPTPHLNTQIQVHQNAKGTQSLQKGQSDDDYSKGYTQITADQLRAELGESIPQRAKNDPTGMSVPDTNISATM
jgi:hypothetical protein